MKPIFSPDFPTAKQLTYAKAAPPTDAVKIIRAADASQEAIRKGDAFAQEITDRMVGDFERAQDRMAHVSTFLVVGDTVFVTYYANTKEPLEDPKNQTARLAYAPISDPQNKIVLDLQTTGDMLGGKEIDMVYDTILMQKDSDTLMVLWTARTTDENYYRFYCPFTVSTKTLGEIGVNRFKVGDVTNDFSATGIRGALAENELPCKPMYSDIGIMQKITTRVENGETYYYTGAYSGDFTCIIKSRDFITWEYVSQPDFVNHSQWENATYVIGDKCYYLVRQYCWKTEYDIDPYAFLTVYDLNTGKWEPPVLIEDCQSRADMIMYNGELYAFHAPIDREHIGILRIDTENIANSEIVLQAKMQTSCFYPFVQYYRDGELAMSYTINRQHVRLAEFTLSKYL